MGLNCACSLIRGFFFQQICVSCYNRTQSVLVLILNAEPQIQRADWEVIQRLCRTLILEFCSSRVNLIRRWASESAWRRKWQPTPVFLLENSMGGGAWQAAVHGVAKSWTRLTKWAHTRLGVPRSWRLRLCEWDCCGGPATKSRRTLCDPVDCSTPGLPVLHCLPELTQTHAHWVSDAIHLT